MKIFYSETHRKHEPSFEVFDGGLRTPYLENPDRMDRILTALGGVDWADVIEPADFGLDPILAVHDEDYIHFLASSWTEWLDSKPKDPSTLLPATFALRRHPQKPASLLGRAGHCRRDISGIPGFSELRLISCASYHKWGARFFRIMPSTGASRRERLRRRVLFYQ